MSHAFFSLNVDKAEIQISNPSSLVDYIQNKMADEVLKFSNIFASIEYVYFNLRNCSFSDGLHDASCDFRP